MRRLQTLVFVLSIASSAVSCRESPAPAADATSAEDVTGRAEVAPDICPPLPQDPVGGLAFPSLLRLMGEPPLACGQVVEDEVYRIVLREGAATTPPLSIRLSRSEGVRLVIARQYAWTSDVDPTRPLGVIASRVRALNEDEWRALEMALAATHFWEMPIADASSGASAATPAGRRGGEGPGSAGSPDGAVGDSHEGGQRWQLEGRRGRGYHHVERTDVGAGAFGDLARHLLRVGGFAEAAR